MARHIELLLLKNIEHLGIVGDVVRVKRGYARNYLIPHGFAEVPTASRVAMLEEDRAVALAELASLRSARRIFPRVFPVAKCDGRETRLKRAARKLCIFGGLFLIQQGTSPPEKKRRGRKTQKKRASAEDLKAVEEKIEHVEREGVGLERRLEAKLSEINVRIHRMDVRQSAFQAQVREALRIPRDSN